jgi:hypothetical protein
MHDPSVRAEQLHALQRGEIRHRNPLQQVVQPVKGQITMTQGTLGAGLDEQVLRLQPEAKAAIAKSGFMMQSHVE